MVEKKVLFVGTGYMGEEILKGVLGKGIISVENILAYNRNSKKSVYISSKYGVQSLSGIQEGLEQADIVIIATKPQDIDAVLKEIKKCNKNSLIISIAAGIKIKYIEGFIGSSRRITRVMPNPICESGYGISSMNWNDNLSQDDISDVKAIFETIGNVIVINEKLQNAFTGYSASGCAYIFEFIEAMAEAGVLVGFNKQQSMEIIIQNMIGAAKILETTQMHPAVIKEKIASPAGTAITGLHALNISGFRGIVQDCVKKSVNRADEFGG